MTLTTRRAVGSERMLPVSEVLPGVVVFLDCGCFGRRGISPPDAAVVVIIERTCAEHSGPEPQIRYLERWELVSPFTKVTGRDDS